MISPTNWCLLHRNSLWTGISNHSTLDMADGQRKPPTGTQRKQSAVQRRIRLDRHTLSRFDYPSLSTGERTTESSQQSSEAGRGQRVVDG